MIKVQATDFFITQVFQECFWEVLKYGWSGVCESEPSAVVSACWLTASCLSAEEEVWVKNFCPTLRCPSWNQGHSLVLVHFFVFFPYLVLFMPDCNLSLTLPKMFCFDSNLVPALWLAVRAETWKHNHLSKGKSSLIKFTPSRSLCCCLFLILASNSLISVKPSTPRTSWSRSKRGTSTCWRWKRQTHPFTNTTSTTCRT